MTEKCPRCNTLMIQQKAASTYIHETFLYCQKCQTTIFLPSEKDHDQPLFLDDPLRNPKVLLVDDDTDLLTLLDLQFKTAGFDTVLASHGEEAYTKMLETSPDLVIADIFLPTMDGWELSRKIRGNVELGYIPVILITGIYTGPEFKAKALEHGVNAFVTKPYDQEILLNIARKLIDQYTEIMVKPIDTVSS